jgi:NAD(P)H dehydrogenase (quinone)
MPKVLVLFYSRTGNTAAIADAIADGATSIKFTEVELRRIEDLSPQNVSDADEEWKAARASLSRRYRTLESVELLAQFDALIIGSPARYGIMSAELKHTLDQGESLRQRGALADKVGSAFGPRETSNGGGALAVMSMLIPLMHFGMILVPPTYDDTSLPAARGTDARAAMGSGAPAAADLVMARQLGARVAKVAEWVRHAKSHEAHGHKH